jgi:hypothetical protein
MCVIFINRWLLHVITLVIYAAFHPTQDLSLVLLREMFGSELADATARQAEYQWDLADDGTSDPFSHTIPMP